MGSHQTDNDNGFTLAEVVIATAVLGVALTAVASGATAAMVATVRSRDRSVATWLASERLEQLKALAWAFDGEPATTPIADVSTDLSASPQSGGGPGLSLSSPASLVSSEPGRADYLDGQGRWVGNGLAVPADAAYVRRWRVSRVAGSNHALVLEVVVTKSRTNRAPPTPQADDVRLLTIVTRKAR